MISHEQPGMGKTELGKEWGKSKTGKRDSYCKGPEVGWSLAAGCRPIAQAQTSSGSFLEMQNLRPHLRLTKAETES